MSYDYRYTSKQQQNYHMRVNKKISHIYKDLWKKLNDKRASNCSNHVIAEKSIKIARNLYKKIKSLKKELKLYRNSK